MFNKMTLIRQRAQTNRLFCLLPALGIAAFSILFIPVDFYSGGWWFAGLTWISYMLLRWFYGMRSWITETDGDPATRAFCIRDSYASFGSCIPCEYIIGIESCEYTLWHQQRIPAVHKDNPYYVIYTQMGYSGPGLIISYRLPKHLSDVTQVRSWQLPAPKAQQFIALLKVS